MAQDQSKAYIVEAKSDVAEARRLQDAVRQEQVLCWRYDKITQIIRKEQGHATAALAMTEKGVYAISNMSTVSMGAYDRYPP